ncbi:MAG: hypothetical protein DI586_09315 [Micavibrio aeruginosavorus]|uniref:Uncharacterized protein n=1 Tax=Micavibrio aeruginosavorus TaxID=349221 RepID=A0A2W5HGA0_9BACT|nr:MAG: hypothetical protein DI586_09315 [Micavibrio aeruginosavorus]
MFYKENICKNIISVCMGKASLALALGFLIFNPSSAYAWCVQGGGTVCNDGCTPYWSQARGPTTSEIDNSRAVCDAGHGGLDRTAACPYEYNECTSAPAPSTCTLGVEESINDYDGWVGEFGSPGPNNPCQASNYIGSGSGVYENGFASCPTSVGKGNSSPANPGTDSGKAISGTDKGCISRVWYNGSTMANSSRCVVFGYRCSGGGGPAAVNGLCSSTANQCTYGSYVDETDTTTAIQWRCNGQNGGTNSGICSAPRAIPGVCGYASGGTYTTAPAASDSLCTTGSPSSVSGDGTTSSPWRWSCAGQNGGSNAACAANLCLPPVDGLCNNASNNSCARGSLANSRDTSTEFLWECVGENGGATDQCSRTKPAPPVDGACNNTVENGCSAGSLNNTADSATHFLWQCLGTNGGNSASCNMERPAAVNGACSASVNGCNAGDFADVADDAVNYRWQCNGRNGGTNQPCSAAIPPVGPPPTSLPMTGTESGNYANTGGYWYINNVNGYRRSNWNASGQNPDVLMSAGCDGSILHEETQTYKLSTSEFYNKYQGGDEGRSYGMDLMDRYNGYCVGANIVAPDNENFQVHYRVYSGRYNASGRRSELNNEFATCLRTSSASQYNCILGVFGVRP